MIYEKNPEDYQDKEEGDKANNKGKKKDALAYHKTMIIVKNRRLFDVAKLLAHEIEDLMEELRALKEKSYPIFN
jgi:hypothetical protein